MTTDQLLRNIIANQIAAEPKHRITFADYMDLALYHPEQGYYATGAVNIGSEGDFFTSPHLSRDFGELLAEQFAKMWDILGHPMPFTLMEMGAGQGLLAADVLYYLHRHYPDCFEALEYIIIEKAAGLIYQQQQQLHRLKIGDKALPLRWCSLEEIPENSIIGCCFSNELIDAFPVHQVVIEGGQIKEIYVTTANTGIDNITLDAQAPSETNFVEITDTLSTSKLTDYFDFIGIDLLSGTYPEGYRTEVNLAALDWLKTVTKRLHRGFLLTIDYGYSADRYYQPARHQGTLQCYYQHQHHDNPYLYIGQQDITAHVNFTALERQGELCGLRKVGFTQQGLFLMALGLGDRIAALSARDSDRGNAIAKGQDVIKIMQRRQILHQLMDPMGLGGFGVLVQSKGLKQQEEQVPLKGLIVPPMF
ncbi:class I SAM-dependent methyltransferase [Microcoleus sp. FACHB-53]|nr:class I SAM-dependent methyltransferase [Microcoleus sp. FACHB-53]